MLSLRINLLAIGYVYEMVNFKGEVCNAAQETIQLSFKPTNNKTEFLWTYKQDLRIGPHLQNNYLLIGNAL